MKKILKNKRKFSNCDLKQHKSFSEINNILILNKIDYFHRKNFYKKFKELKSELF